MNTIQFDKKCKCCPEFVCVRILDNCDDLKVGSIYLPSTSQANSRLAHCIIEDVGSEAHEKYGLNVGDYVMIDRLSTYVHTAPIALLKFNNVILKTNKDKSEFWPLKNMIFVEPDKHEAETNLGGIVVPNYAERLNTGTVTKMNCDAELNLGIEVGDKVLVTKGADVVQLGTTTLNIFKHDMIICKILD